jgi:hypothetical protein
MQRFPSVELRMPMTFATAVESLYSVQSEETCGTKGVGLSAAK